MKNRDLRWMDQNHLMWVSPGLVWRREPVLDNERDEAHSGMPGPSKADTLARERHLERLRASRFDSRCGPLHSATSSNFQTRRRIDQQSTLFFLGVDFIIDIY